MKIEIGLRELLITGGVSAVLGWIIFNVLAGIIKKWVEKKGDVLLDKFFSLIGGSLAVRRFEKKYLKWIANEHRYLKLVGIKRERESRPELEDLYVSLQVASPSTKEGKLIKGRSVSLSEALKNNQFLVVLGAPGSGKTTMLNYLTLNFATGKIGEKLVLSQPAHRLYQIFRRKKDIPENRIPLYISLPACTEPGSTILEGLLNPDSKILPKEILDKAPKNYFSNRLDKGKCVLLLDGLDEVMDEEKYYAVAEKIKDFVGGFPNNRYVVTCRVAGWRAYPQVSNILPGDFKTLILSDFTRADITGFIRSWHKAVLGKETGEVEEEANRLIEALTPSEGARNPLADIATNPMILSLICLVHFEEYSLPEARAKLYQECIKILLAKKDLASGLPQIAKLPDKEAVLQEIAYNFQDEGHPEKNREEVEGTIAGILPSLGLNISAERLLKDIELRSGILAEQAIDRLGFFHHTFQEYLAAKAILKEKTRYEVLLQKAFANESWQEVLLLYAGMLPQKEAINQFLVDIWQPDVSDPSGKRLRMAGRCLNQVAWKDEELKNKIISQLQSEAVKIEKPELATETRKVLVAIGGDEVDKLTIGGLQDANPEIRIARIGELIEAQRGIPDEGILNQLLQILSSDPKKDVKIQAGLALYQFAARAPEKQAAGLYQRMAEKVKQQNKLIHLCPELAVCLDYLMVEIPAGEFKMGGNENDREKPIHPVYLDGFYISRYEVTNAQYKRFIDANPRWQKGKVEKEYADTSYLMNWQGSNYPEGKANHPVVYVSWHATKAYYEWAGKRLPTEAEWEKAARGGLEGKRYPWGDEFDKGKCNTFESGIGTTTPVGSYPPNEYGLYDMSGNVWEWCADWYGDKYYQRSPAKNPKGPDSGDYRVLRGGSWLFRRDNARCAYRDFFHPGGCWSYGGFRCAEGIP